MNILSLAMPVDCQKRNRLVLHNTHDAFLKILAPFILKGACTRPMPS